MTDLAALFARFAAVNIDGEYRARCTACQPEESDSGRWKVILNPGKSRLLVAWCFGCCSKEDRPGFLRWWFEYCTQVGVDPAVLMGPSDPAAWAALSVRTPTEPTAPPDILHGVYCDMLDRLELLPAHAKWLRKKGLDPDWAFGVGYRSDPPDPDAVAATLYAGWGDRLRSVPGFVVRDGRCQLRTRRRAILTPSRDVEGRVVAIKQRLLDGKGARMRWLSTAKSGGAAAINNVHVPLGVGCRRWPRVWVTEGERKADVFWTRREEAVVAIPGVYTWQRVVGPLRLLCGEGAEVVIALDRDDKGRKVTPPLLTAVADWGYRPLVAEWPDEKGLDDAVTRGAAIDLRPPVAAKRTPSLPHKPLTSVDGRRKLSNGEVLPWLLARGPTSREDVPCDQIHLSRLIREGAVRIVGYDKRGQIVETVVMERPTE